MSGISGGVAVSWHLGWCRYSGGQSEDDRTDHGVGCSDMSFLSFQVRDLLTFFMPGSDSDLDIGVTFLFGPRR